MARLVILIVFCFITSFSKSQTVIRYDNMETWNWLGIWWTPASTAGWFTNASVSPTESAVLYGLGTGTSTIEQDWYSLPNVTGLNTASQYQLKFRLASYTFSNSSATTRGLDVADYISVQVSTNGGVSYVTELRITGNANATWPFTATGTIMHGANGTFTNSAAPAGDVYASPPGASSTGPSTVTLNLQPGITQVAVDLYCRTNSAGEEWWIDNIELWEIPPTSLPVELIYFIGDEHTNHNILKWSTATEHNASHFIVEHSIDGDTWTEISKQPCAGNSTEKIDYSYVDYINTFTFNYYRLLQYDIDGVYKTYGPIALDNRRKQRIPIRYVNMMGQEVNSNTPGIIFQIYDDGTSEKIFN